MSAGLPPISPRGYLTGIRVIEIGNELGEYCGKLLAGLGADVVRIEPENGEVTRSYGPFYLDKPHSDRSLYFWHYNHGKRSVALDLDGREGRDRLAMLIGNVDVVVESRPRGYMAELGLSYDDLKASHPNLIYARISPFGDSGPWRDLEASDLIHLALGGVMMNCGYDPDPLGEYDTPPIAPQMWQSYQIAGEMAGMSILGALNYRISGGGGQYISTSVHEAVSQSTETDLPDWVFLRQEHHRLTCRHSLPIPSEPLATPTKDGRYMFPYRTYLRNSAPVWDGTVSLLKKYGLQADLDDPKYQSDLRYSKEALDKLYIQQGKLIAKVLFSRNLWQEAQECGLPWAPMRYPEENIDDPHWRSRHTFVEVEHPELCETFTYIGAKWYADEAEWREGPRPPLVGEHTSEILAEWSTPKAHQSRVHEPRELMAEPVISKRGKPFAISDVRVVDMGWMLASAGGGRFLSAMGAEVIKIEHESHWDAMRFGFSTCPVGGREERDKATGPMEIPKRDGPDFGGHFMELNAGKLGMALNLKEADGRVVLEDLIRNSDVVIEGFSPGTMTRMGIGYERMKELNPSIIFVSQSGLGEVGVYGRARTYGPTAAAFTGISEMSGLPSPFPPAGIGYSYLDWFGAYNLAVAVLAALYRRNATGLGCRIDASQAETGIYLTGTAILDYSANGRGWTRYGNHSPYKPAAPHGAYRTQGQDRWIAIAAFTDEHWQSLCRVLGNPAWANNDEFICLSKRLANQASLDRELEAHTILWSPFELMDALQSVGVPAGVCQTAQDRYEDDPQLRHDQWLVELDQSTIGTWPVKEHPSRLSKTPAYMGGRFDKSGPTYGEDTEYVLQEILGYAATHVDGLRAAGVIPQKTGGVARGRASKA
jgi:crotonobetainyl-CoA:carnitine CoA-transferase CaiB-like acyl-CoA transferase